jgi:peroxiredoxin
MRRINHWPVRLLVAALSVAIAAGCPKRDAGGRPRVAKGQREVEIFKKPRPEAPDATQKSAKTPQAAKNQEVPKVNLGKQREAFCLVNVGNRMPDGQLPDLDGKAVPLRSLFGSKATVILFWSSENPYALQALRRLGADVVEPFGDKGVRAVGINVKENPDAARKAAAEAGAKFPNVLDAAGAYFARVATKQLPRVYVLDSTGKIRWLDDEYSGITRDSLRQAIEALLAEKESKP